MTTQELIEYLNEFNPNSEVAIISANPKARKKYIGTLGAVTDMGQPVFIYAVDEEVSFDEDEVAAAEQDDMQEIKPEEPWKAAIMNHFTRVG